MADEVKKYLDYDGLKHVVEKLNNKIQAVAGGGTAAGHTGACDGVYVAYMAYDGVKRICAISDWSDSLGAAQGVMVGDGSHEVMVAADCFNGPIAFHADHTVAGPRTAGVITTADEALALTDFNGRANWAALLEDLAAGGLTGYTACVAGMVPAHYYGATPAGEWWLPSMGELRMVADRISDVNAAMAAVGGTQIRHDGEEDFYWSSTQHDDDYGRMWELSMGSLKTEWMSKSDSHSDYNCMVMYVAAWDYVL